LIKYSAALANKNNHNIEKMTTTTIDILTLLQQYEALHSAANDNLKSCLFNITKARKVGTSKICYGDLQYSVDNVREELRAQALLECKECGSTYDIDEESSLVSEESSTSVDNDGKDSGDSKVSKGNRFVLHLDGMRNAKEQHQLAARREEAQEQMNNINTTSIDDNTASEGGGVKKAAPKHCNNTDNNADDKKSADERTTELDAPTSSNNNTEEKRLQYTDPLNLFGIPPPALRVAQAKSRSAIAYYVEVANLAREIIRITNDEK